MAVTARRFTVDEVLGWPEDGNRYELVDGVLLVTPSPVLRHQVVAMRIATQLTRRVEQWPGVHVASSGEILIRPRILMEPDVLVFRTDSLRRKWEQVHEHWLAVEVWSPSSVVYDRDVKRDAYLQVGVREVWQVDLDRKAVLVSRRGGPTDQPFQAQLPWSPQPGGLTEPLDLGELFEGV